MASHSSGGLSETDKHAWEGFEAPQPIRNEDWINRRLNPPIEAHSTRLRLIKAMIIPVECKI